MQQLRENEYPSDEKFLNDITKITISFGDYIINKLTLSLINISNISIVKEEKLSIITDIYSFFNKYNNQYHTKIDFNNIIQSDEPILNFIEKISNNVLVLLFDDNYIEENEEVKQVNKISSELQTESKEDIDNDEIIQEEREEKDCLEFDEFYPKIIKKKGKRTYREAFGDDNEIKAFFDNLYRPIISKKIKNSLL